MQKALSSPPPGCPRNNSSSSRLIWQRYPLWVPAGDAVALLWRTSGLSPSVTNVLSLPLRICRRRPRCISILGAQGVVQYCRTYLWGWVRGMTKLKVLEARWYPSGSREPRTADIGTAREPKVRMRRVLVPLHWCYFACAHARNKANGSTRTEPGVSLGEIVFWGTVKEH